MKEVSAGGGFGGEGIKNKEGERVRELDLDKRKDSLVG